MKNLCKRNVSPDVGLPGIVLTLYLFIAPFSLPLTIIATVIVLLIFIHQVRIAPTVRLQTRTVSIWSLMSFLLFQLVFIATGVFILEITLEESFISMAILLLIVVCFWMTKRRDGDVYRYYASDGYTCLWLNCTVTRKNIDTYMMGLCASIINVFYISNTILKTICHPYLVIGSIVIPDDCSTVYTNYGFSLLFIISLYLVPIGLGFTFILITQIVMVVLQGIQKLGVLTGKTTLRLRSTVV